MGPSYAKHDIWRLVANKPFLLHIVVALYRNLFDFLVWNYFIKCLVIADDIGEIVN